MTKIRVLDAEVVKRISAGETLQRPMNAVKELIENSLDAEADRISVHVQVPTTSSSTETSAGLFSIQVIDNGTGIAKDDLGLLCERHATSKLRSVGDLGSVGTFGFRGEALASCSQVARVDVVTRSRAESSDQVAWKVSYLAGRMTGEPEPIAGNFGTIINVKDLFHANRVRREALLNSNEEYQKILQVMQAYALNQAGKCAFSLSRRRDRMEMQTSLKDTPVDVVKNLWNEEIGAALLPFEIGIDERLGIEGGSCGLATRTTFHKLKSAQVIIFLNGRLIEHATLRRSLLQAFSMHLPTSPPAHPFIYLNLNLKGNRVDVNVHPSKKQVFFLDEAEIVGKVLEAVEAGVLKRQYETQNLEPIVIEARDLNERKRAKVEDKNVNRAVNSVDRVDNVNSVKSATSVKSINSGNSVNRVNKISSLYPSQRILTDNRNHRIDTFLYLSSQREATGVSGWSPLSGNKNKENIVSRVTRDTVQRDDITVIKKSVDNDEPELNPDLQATQSSPLIAQSSPLIAQSTPLITQSSPLIAQSSPLPPISDNFTSSPLIVSDISNELSENNAGNCSGVIDASFTDNDQVINEVTPKVTDVVHDYNRILSRSNAQLCKLLKNSLVVGLIDSRWCLLQSGTNLLLCDMDRLNYELFFSLLLQQGGTDSVSIVKRCFEIEELIVKNVFTESQTEIESSDVIGEEAENVLKDQINFFQSEFGIMFTCDPLDDSLKLIKLPAILPGQRCPSTRFIKTFLQRLCLVPDYTAPPQTVRLKVAEELANLYSLIDTEEWEDWEEYVKHVLLPSYRDNRARFTLRDEFLNYDDGIDNNSSTSNNSSNNSNCSVDVPVKIITNTETLYKSFERC